MLAQPRQIHHEGVFKFTVNVFLHLLEIDIARALRKFGAENFFPVGTANNFFHALPGQ